MQISPFWMEISPFNFFQKRFEFSFEKKSLQIFFLHLKLRNLHSEWIFLHSNVFQKRFWFFEKNIYRELSPLIFFRSVLIFYWKTNSTNNSLHSKSEKSPFWMEISPFNFFFRSGLNFKKISTNNFLHSIFSEVCWFFLKTISTENFLHSFFFQTCFEL